MEKHLHAKTRIRVGPRWVSGQALAMDGRLFFTGWHAEGKEG